IERLVATGSRAYGLKKYDEATENFAKACEEYVKENGKDDPNLLFLYGRALFQVAISSSDVLGGTKPAAAEPENDLLSKKSVKAASPELEPSAKMNGLFQFTGDAEDEDSEDEDEEEEEEAENDFETAWDVLDLARTIYEKQVKQLADGDEAVADIKKKIADIFDILGEISLESENFIQASRDLQSSLDLKLALYPFESTFVSEAYFKLSLATEYNTDIENPRQKAAELVQKAIDSVKKRAADAGGAEESGILTDLETRLQDLTFAPDPATTAAAATPIADILGGNADTIKARLAEAFAGAQDISGLVKRKRP
ncbi:hypothetical protein BZA70DRAFT_224455, partial [Myxozyma melibiosi]